MVDFGPLFERVTGVTRPLELFMDLETRFALAVDLFKGICRESKPADYVVSQYFRRVRGLEPSDKGFLVEAVYAALRREILFRAVVRASRREVRIPNQFENDSIVFLALFAERRAPRSELAEAVSRLTDVPVGTIRKLARFAEENVDAPLGEGSALERFATRHSTPAWLVSELAGEGGFESLAPLLDGLNAEPPLCIRANSYKVTRDELRERLRAEGVVARPTKLSPWALVAKRDRALFGLPTFEQGLFEIQDEGSQLVSLLVDPHPSARVLDACAGAGGKTLHLGALMKGKGDVYAFDPDARRLANLRKRVRRSGLQNVRILEADNDLRGIVSKRVESFDAVLVDAPCSGSGTFRRSPDIKLRLGPELVEEMTERQASILEQIARAVKPGGRIVYATCSVLRAENRDIVEQFLANHSEYELLPVSEALATSRVASEIGLLRERLGEAEYLDLAPHTHNTDAFFGAVLRRRPSD